MARDIVSITGTKTEAPEPPSKYQCGENHNVQSNNESAIRVDSFDVDDSAHYVSFTHCW